MKGKVKGFLGILGTLLLVVCLLPKASFAAGKKVITLNDSVFEYTAVEGSGECTLTARCNDSAYGSYFEMPSIVVDANTGDEYRVTAIAGEVFKDCITLKTLVLPQYLRTIGNKAFFNSTLEGVVFRSDVYLSKQCFQGCRLVNLDLTMITEIGDNLNQTSVFADNQYLSTVIFNDDTIIIGKSAFAGCSQLTDIYSEEDLSVRGLPSGLANSKVSPVIGESAFENCSNLRDFSMKLLEKNSVMVTFDKKCFAGCTDLTEITYAENLYAAGPGAFMGCTKLKKVTLGTKCGGLDAETFNGCIGLEQVTYKGAPSSSYSVQLPSSCGAIGSKAFMGTPIVSIDFPKELKTLGDYTFANCTNLSDLNIPKNIAIIGEGFCQGCTSLKTISIPKATQSIGDSAFNGCTSLQYFNIEAGSQLDGIGKYAYAGCSNLTSYDMPDTVVSLGKGVFQNCNKLTSVDMSPIIESVQDNTFSNCSSLTSISIGNAAKFIGNGAFSGCKNLKEVNMPDDNKALLTIGNNAFNGCTSLKSLRIPEGIKLIPQALFANCTSLNKVTLPSTITTISERVFEGCTSLSALTVPENVTVIPVKMCYGCTGLIAVNLPVGISTVAESAFAKCSSLTTVTNIEKAEEISTKVFQDCTSLKTLKLGPSIDIVPDYLCSGCTSLKSFDFTYITRIGEQSFAKCGFEKLTLPNNIVNIESGAFTGCEQLVSLTLPKNSEYTTVKQNVFNGCKMLSDVTVPTSIEAFGNNAFKDCVAVNLPFDTAPALASGVTASNHPFAGTVSVYVPFKSEGYDEGGWLNSLYKKKSNIFYPGEITLKLTDFNPTNDGANKLSYGEYTLQLSVDKKHSFPDNISVTYTSNGNSVMSYVSYDKDSGTITIDTSKLTGQITITATAVAKANNNDNKATPTPEAIKINREEVEAFVNRCYSLVLERNAEQSGLDYWTDKVVDGKLCGAQLAYGFFFSLEFDARNTSDEQYIEILYSVFLNRQSDASGKAYWLEQLAQNAGDREFIYAGFANSPEFNNLCGEYGIPTGFFVLHANPDMQANVNAFVARLYKLCLNRLPDPGSQAQFVMNLMSSASTGAEVGYTFVFSPEYMGGKPSNSDYVKMLYAVFMGREPDEAGFNSWVEQLGNGTLDEMGVFRGFVMSQEYTNICAEYGITRGEI